MTTSACVFDSVLHCLASGRVDVSMKDIPNHIREYLITLLPPELKSQLGCPYDHVEVPTRRIHVICTPDVWIAIALLELLMKLLLVNDGDTPLIIYRGNNDSSECDLNPCNLMNDQVMNQIQVMRC